VCCIVGHVSVRNVAKGSYFLRALSDKLERAMTSTDSVDFAQVLTEVTRTVAAYNFLFARKKKQVPSLYSTLTKEIHIPKYSENV